MAQQQKNQMNSDIQTQLAKLTSGNPDARNEAYNHLLQASEQPVDWAYEVWDQLVALLRHKDNHVRSIASQVLSNLAKSDPENRMQRDFPVLLAVTKDERFVTARHCLQSLWKIGLVGPAQRKMVVDGLASRFQECSVEKNCTLIRHDIAVDLKQLYDAVADESIQATAKTLIESESDEKYRKKYKTVWKFK